MRLALALTFAIGAAVLASGQQAPATMELRGRVVDALSGAPIPGVAIQGYFHNSMGSESRQARTDAGGAFTLPEIVAGEYSIGAARPDTFRRSTGASAPAARVFPSPSPPVPRQRRSRFSCGAANRSPAGCLTSAAAPPCRFR